MTKPIHRVLALALACAAVPAAQAADDLGALQARCWTPLDLAGRAAETGPTLRPGAAGLAGLRGAGRAAAVPTPPHLRGAIRRVKLPEGLKLIALTFDLCETAGSVSGYDGAIVDYLRANGIRATFFAGGKWLATHAERGQQLLADPLFEIANHGWAHRDMRRLGSAALGDEIALAQAAYVLARRALADRACVRPMAHALAAVPETMRLFRFPFGTCDARALDAVAAAGLLAIQWDVVTGDPARGRSARAIAAAVLRAARPGSIVIAHANGRGWNTAAALPLIIPKLRARGYGFVTVSELIAAGEPEIAASCYTWAPGDQRAVPLAPAAPAPSAERRRDARPLTFETQD